ncbi:glycosyl hydrolase 115 family protein [uncultured Draconibacterium sp.]|uniref:glycosyl hydrolase 115 family protein n=1 Tax=uncultured Draconibacterium sp. TaxID=1573823 RepID=UPI0032602EBC
MIRTYILLFILLPFTALSQLKISTDFGKRSNAFTIVSSDEITSIYYEASENILVQKAASFLASDIEKVSGKKPAVLTSDEELDSKIIVVGTLGNNPLIDRLISNKKLDVSPIKNKWEGFIIETVKNPFDGVKEALVIVGSDRRGTAYGIFTLSQEMGVSPWYWWADVPVKKKERIYLANGRFVSEGPAVKYRGIFINDEAPAFRNWAKEKFGGPNHQCYETIFELLLRNKANYLWPAMWLPTMFNVDDPLNPKVADEYGIVMSTSHHEPMMRSHNEWGKFGKGAWNYETNKENLQEFWREGFERVKDYESVVTVGMRGDGDEAMSEDAAVGLLKEIIADQREIIADVSGKPANETPQVWAVYKEVQEYFDKGMRVDDDIIVLFCDDNWGNLRILPKKEDLSHPAGYGIYYHFDYVGAPVSYRWLNTTQIERTWEQMKLAYEHGVEDLWLVNVGDIKPMELPISFFLDFAWNPNAIQANDLPAYYTEWATQQFGPQYAPEIAELLAFYTKYNARRTPEMLTPTTYSIENFREADRIVDEYKTLLNKSETLYKKIPGAYKPAFYQLVQSPIELSANINEMYVAAGKNKYYAERGAVSANYYAQKVKELFDKDAELTQRFHEHANGKWNHMMSQTHIGYTSWNHPPLNTMPAVSYVQVDKPAELGYLLEYGKKPRWGWLDVEADWSFSNKMPVFDAINKQNYYIDIINKGEEKLSYSLHANEDWIILSKTQGTIQFNEKIYVSIDWDRAPIGEISGSIKISGAGSEYLVEVPVFNQLTEVSGFVENSGVIAFEAVNYSKKFDSKEIYWTEVPNLGRTASSLIVEPVNAERVELDENSPHVVYDFTVFEAGDITVETFLSPTQDFRKEDGLRFAISIDDEEPQIINMNEGEEKPDWQYAGWWTKSVGDHIKIKTSKHRLEKPGKHTLKIWMIDPGIVFQKYEINTGAKKYSYLGAPESLLVK